MKDELPTRLTAKIPGTAQEKSDGMSFLLNMLTKSNKRWNELEAFPGDLIKVDYMNVDHPVIVLNEAAIVDVVDDGITNRYITITGDGTHIRVTQIGQDDFHITHLGPLDTRDVVSHWHTFSFTDSVTRKAIVQKFDTDGHLYDVTEDAIQIYPVEALWTLVMADDTQIPANTDIVCTLDLTSGGAPYAGHDGKAVTWSAIVTNCEGISTQIFIGEAVEPNAANILSTVNIYSGALHGDQKTLQFAIPFDSYNSTGKLFAAIADFPTVPFHDFTTKTVILTLSDDVSGVYEPLVEFDIEAILTDSIAADFTDFNAGDDLIQLNFNWPNGEKAIADIGTGVDLVQSTSYAFEITAYAAGKSGFTETLLFDDTAHEGESVIITARVVDSTANELCINDTHTLSSSDAPLYRSDPFEDVAYEVLRWTTIGAAPTTEVFTGTKVQITMGPGKSRDLHQAVNLDPNDGDILLQLTLENIVVTALSDKFDLCVGYTVGGVEHLWCLIINQK